MSRSEYHETLSVDLLAARLAEASDNSMELRCSFHAATLASEGRAPDLFMCGIITGFLAGYDAANVDAALGTVKEAV